MMPDKALNWLLAVVISGVFFYLSHPLLDDWFPRWNCRMTEVNVRTGQLRERRYIQFLRTSERILDTPLSTALAEPVGVLGGREWHLVYLVLPCSPGTHFHPGLHSAAYQLHRLERLFDTFQLSVERKAEIAKEVLRLWQATGKDDGAGDYINTLSEEYWMAYSDEMKKL